MNSDNICRMDAGQFHGHVVHSRKVGGFLLKTAVAEVFIVIQYVGARI